MHRPVPTSDGLSVDSRDAVEVTTPARSLTAEFDLRAERQTTTRSGVLDQFLSHMIQLSMCK